jgi:hypothetical protein
VRLGERRKASSIARSQSERSPSDQAASATRAGASQYRGVWIISSSAMALTTSCETIPTSNACSRPVAVRRTTLWWPNCRSIWASSAPLRTSARLTLAVRSACTTNRMKSWRNWSSSVCVALVSADTATTCCDTPTTWRSIWTTRFFRSLTWLRRW